jgi:hypothetical protein
MSVGIDKLVDAFMGNPAPLEAKVKKDQQGQKPGELPEDFEEALALQQINELRQGAQNQQAMQAGGAQPSVVEKLKQMLAAQQRGQSQPMPGQPPQFQPPQGQPQMAQGPQGGPPPMPQGPQGGPPPAPQGQPVMAARGGSIDQLMSNLGRHYAGGGIIAFTPGGDVEDKEKLTEEEAREIAQRMKQRTNMMPDSMRVTDLDVTSFPELQKSDLYAKALARAQGTKPEPSNEDIKKALAFVSAPAAAGLDVLMSPLKFLANTSFRNPLDKEPPANYTSVMDARNKYLYGEKPAAELAASAEPSKKGSQRYSGMPSGSGYNLPEGSPNPTIQNTYIDKNGVRQARPPNVSDEAWAKHVHENARRGEQTPTSRGPGDRTAPRYPNPVPRKEITGTSPDDVRPTQPRPSASGPSVGGPAAPAAALDPNSLRALIEANIRKELGKDESAEWAKGAKRYEDFMGIDKLLQPREARIAERQEMIRRLQGERTPAWVEALSAAGTPIRGGVGSLINMMGNKAEATRKGYSAEDLKFFDEIGAMQDEVAKLKLEGKYKAAAAGEAAIKDVIANKRQSESSGASLVATDERAEASKQIALDNRLARAQTAAIQAANVKAANQQRQQNWIAEQERKSQETLNRNPEYKALIEQRAMQERLLNISTNPKTQEKAQAAIDAINEKIAKMLPAAGGGAANIPPPPKGAVTRVG